MTDKEKIIKKGLDMLFVCLGEEKNKAKYAEYKAKYAEYLEAFKDINPFLFNEACELVCKSWTKSTLPPLEVITETHKGLCTIEKYIQNYDENQQPQKKSKNISKVDMIIFLFSAYNEDIDVDKIKAYLLFLKDIPNAVLEKALLIVADEWENSFLPSIYYIRQACKRAARQQQQEEKQQ